MVSLVEGHGVAPALIKELIKYHPNLDISWHQVDFIAEAAVKDLQEEAVSQP
jgi:hypothetical protein